MASKPSNKPEISFTTRANPEKTAAEFSSVQVGRLRCTVCSVQELANWILNRMTKPAPRGRTATVLCVNAHIYNCMYSYPYLEEVLREADVLAADGVSMVRVSRFFGAALPERCNMTEAFRAFLALDAGRPIRCAVAGCSIGEAESAAEAIAARQPKLEVVAFRDGYGSDAEIITWGSTLGDVDLILIGMGTPRSERIVHALKKEAGARVIWHVGGGTLRFLAGTDREAPAWMRKAGIQWLHRLLRNPAGMWRRYLLGNPLFLFRVARPWKG